MRGHSVKDLILCLSLIFLLSFILGLLRHFQVESDWIIATVTVLIAVVVISGFAWCFYVIKKAKNHIILKAITITIISSLFVVLFGVITGILFGNRLSALSPTLLERFVTFNDWLDNHQTLTYVITTVVTVITTRIASNCIHNLRNKPYESTNEMLLFAEKSYIVKLTKELSADYFYLLGKMIKGEDIEKCDKEILMQIRNNTTKILQLLSYATLDRNTYFDKDKYAHSISCLQDNLLILNDTAKKNSEIDINAIKNYFLEDDMLKFCC